MFQSFRGDFGGVIYDCFLCFGVWRGLDIDDDYVQLVKFQEQNDFILLFWWFYEFNKEFVCFLNSNDFLIKI